MDVLVDRGSVAPGDDADPHARRFTFPDGLPLEEVLARIVASGYLPTIAGGRATWSVTSAAPLAVVAQQGPAPRFVPGATLDASRLARQGDALALFFRYHAQVDPDDVLARLA